jgi:acyl-CoA synthetase (AMP-forming)/AMP-acid ligase II
LSVTLRVPASSGLSLRYHNAGWWNDDGLSAGLEAIAERDGNRVAVIDNVGTWTYAKLREAVERAIHALQSLGVEPGDSVLLVSPNSFDGVVAFLSILRCSAVTVALDRRCGASDVAHAVETTAPRLVVMPRSLVMDLRVADHHVRIVTFDELHSATGTTENWKEPDQSAAAIVLFTSGTTSRPKGVIHSLHSFLSGVRNLATAFDFADEDAPFLSSPVASITGLSQVQMALGGGHIVLENKFDAVTSLDHLELGGATVLGGAPVIAEMLLAECVRRKRVTTPLRAMALGGSMIPRPLLEMAIDRFSIRPVRVYGSSEAPIHTASRKGDSLDECVANDGSPMAGAEIAIGTPNDESELRVRGPNLFLGYLSDAENERSFVDGWFCTGDRAQILGGRLLIQGRLKEVVARKGLKISLPEIDEAIRGFPAALESATYSVPDAETGERLVVAIRAGTGDRVSFEAVSEFLLDVGLARWKLPEQIVLWDEPLPRTASGKILRDRLASDGEAKPTILAPRLLRKS